MKMTAKHSGIIQVILFSLLVLYASFKDALAQGVRTECDAPSAYLGHQARVTCYFSEDLSKTYRPFAVYWRSFTASAGAKNEEIVLQCYWKDLNKLVCDKIALGFDFNYTVSNKVTLVILEASLASMGKYDCRSEPSYPQEIKECDFSLIHDPPPSTHATSTKGGSSKDNKDSSPSQDDDSSRVVGIVVGVFLIIVLVVAAIIVFIFRERLRSRFACLQRRKASEQNKRDLENNDEPLLGDLLPNTTGNPQSPDTSMDTEDETSQLSATKPEDAAYKTCEYGLPVPESSAQASVMSSDLGNDDANFTPAAPEQSERGKPDPNSQALGDQKFNTDQGENPLQDKSTEDGTEAAVESKTEQETKAEASFTSDAPGAVGSGRMADTLDEVQELPDTGDTSQLSDTHPLDSASSARKFDGGEKNLPVQTDKKPQPTEKDQENDQEHNLNLLFYQNKIPCLPDKATIDDIHKNWWMDYDWIEKHPGIIQWLFPVDEDPKRNPQAQRLHAPEVWAIMSESDTRERFIRSYEMMLNFYGLKLANPDTGEIERNDNWRARFDNLQKVEKGEVSHNYLRISRILSCLGQMGLEEFQVQFVQYIIGEMERGELLKTRDSCKKFWITTINDPEKRDLLNAFIESLYVS